METNNSTFVASTRCPNPECRKELKFRTPGKPGTYKLKCHHCSTLIKIQIKGTEGKDEKVDTPAQPAQPAPAPSPTRTINAASVEKMVLVQKRRFRSDISHKLNIGDTFLGRSSHDNPSDIQFNDDYMSTRSVRITAIYDDSGFNYKLTVLRTTNPVFFNQKQLCEGESLFVKSGDTIQMGKTILTFQKA